MEPGSCLSDFSFTFGIRAFPPLSSSEALPARGRSRRDPAESGRKFCRQHTTVRDETSAQGRRIYFCWYHAPRTIRATWDAAMGERLVTLAGKKDNPADNECPAEDKGCYGFVRRPLVTGILHLWLLNVLVPCATQMRLRIAPTACPSLVSPCYENRTYSALEDVCAIIMMVTRTSYALWSARE